MGKWRLSQNLKKCIQILKMAAMVTILKFSKWHPSTDHAQVQTKGFFGGLIKGEKIQIRLQLALQMGFCWGANDGSTLNVGLVALWFFKGSGPVLLRNPIFLWFFMGSLEPLSSPSLWICACRLLSWDIKAIRRFRILRFHSHIQDGYHSSNNIFSQTICLSQNMVESFGMDWRFRIAKIITFQYARY